jgi:hypothetical protein
MTLTANAPSQEMLGIVAALKGRFDGRVAMCRCPVHRDHTPSLSIRQGDRAIIVHCFAGCDPGDILAQLRLLQPGTYHDYKDEGPRRQSCGHIHKLWRESISVRDTPAQTYLDARNIHQTGDDLRYHERCPHGKAPHTLFKPALLVGVRQDHQLVAIQRIFLLDGGSRYETKVMLGTPGVGAWKGSRPSGDTLAIAEGFEDAARFEEINGIACWSSLGASRLGLVRIPDHIKRVIIAEDNDEEGEKAAIHAAALYSELGLAVERMSPAPAPDWGCAR